MTSRYDDAFLDAVKAEVERARSKFPSNRHLMTALTEEVGEVAMALLDNHHKNAPHNDVRDELKQVACVALRLATEGDSDFTYDPRQVPWMHPKSSPVSLNLKATVGGDFEMTDISFGPVTVLPDGSSYATLSSPLPEGHWLTQEGPSVPPMPFRVGVVQGWRGPSGPSRRDLAEMVRAAGRYAIRASTMNGEHMDFDPDAMLRNFTVGMLGYFSEDGLCGGGDDPDPVPPMLKSITWEEPK